MSNVLNLLSEETYTEQTDGIISAINGFGSGLLEYATSLAFKGANLPELINVKINGSALNLLRDTTGVKKAYVTLSIGNNLTYFAANSTVEEIVFEQMQPSAFSTFNGTSDGLKKLIVPHNVINAGAVKIYGELVDDSLVSIGNGLITRSSGTASLTLSANSSAKLNTLTGTVTDGVFTQGEGTVTLYDFITQTKGWTVV